MSWRFWCVIAVFLAATVLAGLLPHGEAITPAVHMAAMPTTIAGWSSTDHPITERIVSAAGVDDYVNRVYEKPGAQPLALYVGYYKSQRTGDTIHSPKNCLPGGGWQPLTSTTVLLKGQDGHQYRVNLYIVEKNGQRQVVLYWYQSHGRVIASEYWAKVYMVLDAVRLNRTDAALVRVTTPILSDEQQANNQAVFFAEQVMPKLDEIIPR